MKVVEISTPSGFKAQILTYGATLIGLYPKDREGNRSSAVLSYPNLEDYASHPAYLGSTVGRWAGRIEKGRFSMDGGLVDIESSSHPNGHHGGPLGISHVEWTIEEQLEDSVLMSFLDVYQLGKAPGDVTFKAYYKVMEIGDEEILEISYSASTTEKTYVNLTNHAYFNLGPHDQSVHEHTLKLAASKVAYVNEEGVPLETLVPVTGTAFDFLKLTPLAHALDHSDDHSDHHSDDQIRLCKGLDHPFCLDTQEEAVVLVHPASGLSMKIDTNQPYCVVYSGNYNDAWTLSSGERLAHQGGICFEMQKIPNAPNRADQENLWLEPGDLYEHKTRYRFSSDTSA